jgi:hypothetical protein
VKYSDQIRKLQPKRRVVLRVEKCESSTTSKREADHTEGHMEPGQLLNRMVI